MELLVLVCDSNQIEPIVDFQWLPPWGIREASGRLGGAPWDLAQSPTNPQLFAYPDEAGTVRVIRYEPGVVPNGWMPGPVVGRTIDHWELGDQETGLQFSSCAWSQDGKAIVVTSRFAPYLRARTWDDATLRFGAEYGPPPEMWRVSSSAPTTTIVAPFSVRFTPSGAALVVGAQVPTDPIGGNPNFNEPIVALHWDSTTGFGARYAMPVQSQAPAYLHSVCVRWAPDGSALASAGQNGFDAWQWDDTTGFGARAAGSDPSPATGIAFSPSLNHVVVSRVQVPFVIAYGWDGVNFVYLGLGSLPTEDLPAVSRQQAVSFSADGSSVAVGHWAIPPYIAVYQWAEGWAGRWPNPPFNVGGSAGVIPFFVTIPDPVPPPPPPPPPPPLPPGTPEAEPQEVPPMHTAAEIVITRPLFVAWSWATPQAGYRVRVYSDGPATFDVLAYSSGVVASSHPVHAVPAGVLGNQRTYWLIVDTYGIDGSVGQSEFVQFDIDWALCGAPANFAAAPVGGDCTGDPSVLPVIRLTWDPVTAVARAAEIDAALTLSGNEITDASRQTGLQGDGREVQDSTAGIWQPSTNIASQSGFEALLSSWAAGGTGVLSLSGDAKFGVASGRLVVAGGGGTLGQVFTRTNGLPLTVSLWAKAVDGVRPFVVSIYDNVAATIRKQATFVPSTSAWTRFVLTASSAEMTAATAFTLFLAPVDVDAEILFDGVQIEQLSIATPYIEVPATTPQSRAAARVQIPMTGMTGTQGWVAARVRVGWANGATDTPGGSRRLWEWGDDANNRFELSYVAAGNTWDMLRRAGGAGTLITQGAGTFSPGDWVLVIGRWTNLTFGISLDGAPFTDGGEANPLTLAAVLADLGTAPLAAGGDTTILSGDLDWVAMGTGTLTDSDAATLYGLLYEPRLCDMTAALGDAAAPLIMWNALDGVAQYTAPVVFEGYDVLRRALPQETAWTRIGVLTDRLNGRFDDAGVNSDQPYEYTVSWRGSDGSFSMTSLESVARIEQQGFDWLWVHKAVDSSLNMRLLSVEHETSVDQDVALIPIWGAAHPIAQFGEQVATTIHVRSGPGKMDAPSEWQELLAFLADQQDDGAVYCVRFGRAQEMYYAVAVTPKLAAHLADYDVDVEFREVDFDVSVPLGGV